MEDTLSLKDALDAAIRYRVIRAAEGVEFEVGGADDHLMDRQQALALVRFALERGDEITMTVPEEPDQPEEQ